jgi:hypothetical protein
MNEDQKRVDSSIRPSVRLRPRLQPVHGCDGEAGAGGAVPKPGVPGLVEFSKMKQKVFSKKISFLLGQTWK